MLQAAYGVPGPQRSHESRNEQFERGPIFGKAGQREGKKQAAKNQRLRGFRALKTME
jgi:hypothetical protein